MFNVDKKQPNRQTGSRNLIVPKTLPTIWHIYVKLVTKYQIIVDVLMCLSVKYQFIIHVLMFVSVKYQFIVDVLMLLSVKYQFIIHNINNKPIFY
jgi:hypothetical protein